MIAIGYKLSLFKRRSFKFQLIVDPEYFQLKREFEILKIRKIKLIEEKTMDDELDFEEKITNNILRIEKEVKDIRKNLMKIEQFKENIIVKLKIGKNILNKINCSIKYVKEE